MKKTITITFSLLILGLILSIAWAINIVPKQMEYTKQCENICTNYNDYEVSFKSYPWNNINGKCYCVNKSLKQEHKSPET